MQLNSTDRLIKIRFKMKTKRYEPTLENSYIKTNQIKRHFQK